MFTSIVCLFGFVFFWGGGLSSHSRNSSLIWRRHHYRWRAANFYLFSALMAIEQWRFFSVPHLLWHGASVYNGHIRGPVTLTYCRAFSSGAVTSCFYDLGLSRLGFENPTFRLRGQRSNPVRHRRDETMEILHIKYWYMYWPITFIKRSPSILLG